MLGRIIDPTRDRNQTPWYPGPGRALASWARIAARAPSGPWAQRTCAFKVIGMQFHQTGRDVIPRHCRRAALGTRPGINIGDHPILQCGSPGFDPTRAGSDGHWQKLLVLS